MEQLKIVLKNACSMSLRLPKPDQQYIILSDASYHAAGYVLMVEDFTLDQDGKKLKQYAPVSFGSKMFKEAQLKMSVHAKEFLAVHFALDTFAHIIWGTRKPLLVLTDNQALIRFFQKKIIPPPLWNAVDHVLSFNFILGHIPGVANPASDFLSRMHTNPEDKLELTIKDKVKMQRVEINFRAKQPDNELSGIFGNEDTDDEGSEAEEEPDDDFLTQLSQSSAMTAKQKKAILAQLEEQKKTMTSFTTFERPGDNLIGSLEDNPLDSFDLKGKTQKLNMCSEQARDPDIQVVITWIRDKKIPDTKYASTD